MRFQIALSVVLCALCFMAPGYIVCKMGKAKASHLPTLSGLLLYVGTPFMVISAFLDLPRGGGYLADMGLFFLVTLILQALFFLLIFFVTGASQKKARRMIAIGATCGNVGFFGIPVVKALLPDSPEVACYAICFTLSMNVLVFTLGVFCLTGDKKYISLRAALCNPTVFGLAIGLPLYLSGLGTSLPSFLDSSIRTLGALTTPLCMFILGIRLASMPLSKIFTQKYAYLICFFKLALFPLLCYGVLLPFSLPFSFSACLVILASTPCAAVILSLAELHHSEEQLSASALITSVLLCLVTIPLVSLLVFR